MWKLKSLQNQEIVHWKTINYCKLKEKYDIVSYKRARKKIIRLQNNESFLRIAFYELKFPSNISSVVNDNSNESYKERKHCRSSIFDGLRLSNSLDEKKNVIEQARFNKMWNGR